MLDPNRGFIEWVTHGPIASRLNVVSLVPAEMALT
jgi:hypothetical protein